VLVAATLALGAASASATTGSMPLGKPPIFTVSPTHAKPFLGKFTLGAHAASLISATLDTSYNHAGYLEGQMAVYSYNSGGQEISWLGTTYEYHYVHGTMVIDLWSPDGSLLFGHLKLRAIAGRRLSGQLVLGAQAQKATFHLAG
jgi:hypothetical protein